MRLLQEEKITDIHYQGFERLAAGRASSLVISPSFLTFTIMELIRMIIDVLFNRGLGLYEKAYSDGYADGVTECNQNSLKGNCL